MQAPDPNVTCSRVLAKRIRRAVGLIFLVSAISVIVLAEIVLKVTPAQQPMLWLCLYSTCFFSVVVVMFLALYDFIEVRRDLLEQNRALVREFLLDKEFLQKLQEKAEEKARRNGNTPSPGEEAK